MEILQSYFCNQDKKESYRNRVVYEGEIQHSEVKATASGGVEMTVTTGDEFGNELSTKVVISRFDLMLLRNEGLV